MASIIAGIVMVLGLSSSLYGSVKLVKASAKVKDAAMPRVLTVSPTNEGVSKTGQLFLSWGFFIQIIGVIIQLFL